MERRGQMTGGRRIGGKWGVRTWPREQEMKEGKKRGKKARKQRGKQTKNCRLITTSFRQHAQNYRKRKLKRWNELADMTMAGGGCCWSIRADALEEDVVDPLSHWLTQTHRSIGPEGTRSLQARQSITQPGLHTATTHCSNGLCGDPFWMPDCPFACRPRVCVCVNKTSFKIPNSEK